MMKKMLFVFSMLVLFAIPNFAQQYPVLTIMDIQYQDPDSLILFGDKPSPYLGDTVTVTGVVMVAPYRGSSPDSQVVIRAGVPALYLQDTSETDWAGILLRFPPSGNADFNTLDTGMVITVTGKVTEFFVTTQMDVVSFDASGVVGFQERPQPVVITLDSLANIGTNIGKPLAERWEGVYVEVRNVTVGSNSVGAGSFSLVDGNNTEVLTGNQSSYFYTSYTPPAPGTVLEYVRGFIQNRDNLPQGYAHLICPMYPGDVKIAQFPPAISSVTRDIVDVGFGEAVTVSANITDQDGTVASAKLIWRANTGTDNEVVMTNTGGSTWQGVIPAQNDSTVINFYIQSTDNQGNTSTNPSNIVNNRYFYLVLNRDLTIKDVQYSPFGSGFSGYNNYEVTLRGIVTSDSTDIQGDGQNTGVQIIMQDGTGPWSAIRIVGTEALSLKRGDDVTVTGTVQENFSVTVLANVNSPSDIITNQVNQPLPEAQLLSTEDINFKQNGNVEAEQWESVLVKYQGITVTDENADGEPGPDQGSGGSRNFGEILVADASNVNTRVELQDGTHSYHNYWAPELAGEPNRIITNDTFAELKGIMFYSFGNYKLIPRKDDDFTISSAVEDNSNKLYDYSLNQNYPNPFNPSTRIDYSIKEAGLVTLKVYNILGQQVAALVNEFKSPGRYNVNFDASNLSSGIYLYKIQANGFTQTKKMILIK